MTKRGVRRSFVGTSAGVLAYAASAWAQQPQEQSVSLEEIVVTAQKRSENLSDVPIAISVVGGEALERSGINNAESLGVLVPSLTFKKGTTNVNSTLNLRGIGTQSFSSAAEPSVATVIDNVVYARSGMAFSDLTDVERIEVLRGPQGTLFGKNASAGVLNIVTKSPTNTFTGTAALSAYDREEYRLALGASGPLSDTASGRISAFAADYDGNAKNTFNNSYVNGYKRYGARGKLLFNLTSNLNLTLIGDYTRSDDDCCADVIGDFVPNAALTNILFPSLSPVVPGAGNRDIDNDLQPQTDDKTGGVSAQFDYQLGDFTLTSITAWRDWYNREIRDGDFHAGAANYVNAIDRQLHDDGDLDFTQYTQEFRLASPTDQFIDYVVGLFYYRTDQDNTFTRNVLDCTASTLPVDATGSRPCAAGVSTFVTTTGTANFNTDFENIAVFGQGTMHVTDRWRLLAGARYTRDEVSYDFARVSSAAGPGISASFASTGEVEEDDVSFKAGTQFDLTEQTMAYATYAQGYKGPAFNVFFNMAAANTAPIDPEESDAYEIGLKSALLDQRLVLNVAAFRAEYTGFQTNSFININGAVATSLTNAGEVRTQGGEADLIYRPVDSLTLNANVAYTDAKIVSYTCPAGLSPAQLATCLAHNGKVLPYAPEWKGNIGFDWRLPFAQLPFDIRLTSSYAITTDINFDIDQNPLAVQDGYELWDASAIFSTKDDRYSVALTAKNITDELYTTFKTPTGAATAPGTFVRNQIPRDAERFFGVSFKANFGR